MKSAVYPPAKIEDILDAIPRAEFLDSTILFEDSKYSGESAPTRLVLPSKHATQKMLEALELTAEDRVLHVGTGFGFTALALSIAAAEVVSLERLAHRAQFARERLQKFGRANFVVLHTDRLDHERTQGPFDAILVETTGGEVTEELLSRLAVGGRLVATLGVTPTTQRLVRHRRLASGQLQREALDTIHLVPPLEEILIDLGVTDRERARNVRNLSDTKRISIINALLQSSDADEAEIYRALALQRSLRLARTEELIGQIQEDALDRIPRTFMKHNQFVPIKCVDSTFTVASPNPDADLSILRGAADCEHMQLVLVTPTDYRRLWRAIELEQYGAGSPSDAAEWEAAPTDRFSSPQSLEDELPIQRSVAIFDGILLDAVGERASDIHFERYEDEIRVRFRIDGECVDMKRYRISPKEMAGIVNVIKIGANLDIAERRLPQGGRMDRKVGNRHFDLRVQTQPTRHGEYVVIRLLPRDNRLITIRELGFPDELAAHYERLLVSPAGMVLVVGPTGSGKSTTLYAGLQLLADDATRKVITVEDPIEYSIDRIQQTQVKPRIGFSFADAMRSFVRQDPDVILVGEIRDHETALEAIRASQTGHLVLSTLHSNDAVDAVQRLFDLGMQPNSVASELIGVIAQRLAKRICTECKEPATPDPSIAAEVFPDGVPDGFTCYRGRGCSRCEQRGTRGRIAVVEYLKVTATVRRAIAEKLQVDELRSRCLASGLATMRDTSLEMVQQGLISFDELRRIMPEERLAPEETLTKELSNPT